jgi:hypothetical protein
MGHVKIPLQMSWIKGRIWIPGKRMLSSVSRGPSVSLNFGVFFSLRKNQRMLLKASLKKEYVPPADQLTLQQQCTTCCPIAAPSGANCFRHHHRRPYVNHHYHHILPRRFCRPSQATRAPVTLPYAEGWPRVIWGGFFFSLFFL